MGQQAIKCVIREGSGVPSLVMLELLRSSKTDLQTL